VNGKALTVICMIVMEDGRLGNVNVVVI